jgi:DNA polymerase-1
MIDLLPVTMTVCNNFEADDGISYTAKYRKENNLGHVYIVSCDKDFYQLIDSDVSVYNPMSKKIFGRNEVIEEFGIHPNNWLLYRAIVGDVSDNIDGVKGLGPKTLLKIFSLESDIKFDLEDVETVCDSVEVNSKKPDTLTKNLLKIKENLSKIKRNWELMNLSSPMLTSNSREVLDGAMTESTHFKKLEFWKASTNNCLNLNLPSFDNLRFLTKGKNK